MRDLPIEGLNMDTATSLVDAPQTDSPAAGEDAARTFRGRSLEEVLPRVREELGADAIVLRRRQGRPGGGGGFCQRPCVESGAPRPQRGEPPELTRNDRATAEGLSSPAIQALV